MRLRILATSVISLVCPMVVLLVRMGWLAAETQVQCFLSHVQTLSSSMSDNLLSASLLLLLFLFRLKKSQFFLLNPVSIDFCFFNGSLSLSGIGKIYSFTFVILVKSQFGRRRRLDLNWRYSFNISFSALLLILVSLLSVLILVDNILDIAYISVSSSGFSGAITA
jgi:hypothetical protein